MNEFRTASVSTAGESRQVATRNRVLRNTYWLLAISMIPTVLGAVIGVQTGIAAVMGASPGITAILFLAVAFGMMYLIEKNRDSAVGVGLLLAFTFFMGIMLSRLIGFVMGMGNGAALISIAFGGTAAVFGTMAVLSTTIKRDLTSLSKWLFIGAVMLIVASLGNIFLQIPALTLTVAVLAIGIFSAFVLVDLQRVQNGTETNYVSATLSVYLSLYNVFQSLLMILGIVGGDRE